MVAIRAVVFDRGDTLMWSLGFPGLMADWLRVQLMEEAAEALKAIGTELMCYVASNAEGSDAELTGGRGGRIMIETATMLRHLQQQSREYGTGNRGAMAKQQDCATVQSVARAIEILKAFSWERPERGVNELARELGVHKSTVSRLMTTLECGGLLSRDPVTDRYRLGIDLIGLAAQVVSHLDVRDIARPYLRQLADGCQETVNLVVLDTGQVVNLEQFVPPARQVKNIGWIGRRMPPHCTAAGKVLLATMSPEEIDHLLPAELERFTLHTITDLRELHLELARTLEQGYAVVEEELEEGLNAIAAPLYDHLGGIPAAVSIAGPAYRVTPTLFPHLAGELIETTSTISRRLGHSR